MGTAYTGVQQNLNNQQQLLNALQIQNGLANQTSVYGGLQQIAAGQGPNPAQNMLNQATGQNVANQAALMAGQRGANQNAGLIARQAAQQGASAQQQAAGQAATMQSQQELNALGQMGGMANTMAANQIGQTNANVQSQLGEQQNLFNANAGMNQVNAGLIGATAQQQAAIGGGGMQGLGSMMSALAEGGEVTDPQADSSAYKGQSRFGAFLSGMGNGVASGDGSQGSQNPLTAGMGALGKGIGTYIHNQNKKNDNTDNDVTGDDIGDEPPVDNGMAKGGKVPALLSPGEKYLPPKEAKAAAEGKIDPIKAGKTVPGKPKVKGAVNSYKNDTVKATLEEGGIVIPRSVTQGANPHWEAMKFVRAHMAKNRKGM